MEVDLNEKDAGEVLLSGTFNGKPTVLSIVLGCAAITGCAALIIALLIETNIVSSEMLISFCMLLSFIPGVMIMWLMNRGHFRVYESGVMFKTGAKKCFYSFDIINHAATETVIPMRRRRSLPFTQLTIYMKDGYAVFTDADLPTHSATLSEMQRRERSGGFGVLCNFINDHAKLKK